MVYPIRILVEDKAIEVRSEIIKLFKLTILDVIQITDSFFMRLCTEKNMIVNLFKQIKSQI